MDLRSLIQPCRPDQLSEVLALLETTDLIFGCDSPASLEAQLAHDPASILVAELDGKVVGCLFVLFQPLLTGLYHLAVAPEHRQSGLANALVAVAEGQARQRGTACLCAYIRSDNALMINNVGRFGYDAYEHPVTCVSKLTG